MGEFEYGWSKEGFGNWFKRKFKEAANIFRWMVGKE